MEERYLELEFPLEDNLNRGEGFHIYDREEQQSLCENWFIMHLRGDKKYFSPDRIKIFVDSKTVCEKCEVRLNEIIKNTTFKDKLDFVFKGLTKKEKKEILKEYIN